MDHADSQPVRVALDEFQLTAFMGRICDFHLPHGIRGFLVHRSVARFRHDPGQGYQAISEKNLQFAQFRLDRKSERLAAI